MTTKELETFFEENEFIVNLSQENNVQCGEIEKWTNGGVDMLIFLRPFTIEEFKNRVNNFDIDEEITLHREGKDYCNAFTIRESLEDFEEFEKDLKEIAEKL